MGKADRIVATLTRRINQGDYLAAPLPSERVLADQENVSYMTARKAVLALIDRGILSRADNGRLIVSDRTADPTRPLQIAFIAPAFPSPDALNWCLAVERMLNQRGAAAKLFPYVHWEDPLIRHALERCDGAFFYPICGPVPPTFLELMVERRVVVVDQDYSSLRIPSIRMSPTSALDDLLDTLVADRPRPVVCLNNQTHDLAIDGRIAGWQAWLARRGLEGRLIDEACPPFLHTAHAAYETVRRHDLRGCSIFATTFSTVCGAQRALHEQGLVLGRDIPTCTLNDEGLGAIHVPSITALEAADPTPFLEKCLTWMADPRRRAWSGPLLMEPADPAIAVRESTPVAGAQRSGR